MSKRKHHTQEVAAALAGMSGRTARRIEHDGRLPSQKSSRAWRTRHDPFAEVWERGRAIAAPRAPAQGHHVAVQVQEAHPGLFPDSMRRTLK